MPALPLNNQNLPYPDPIHPIIVHFVIAMVFFSFFCDVVGYLTRHQRLLEVSWWNMFVAAVCIFLAVIFGQLEAGLAQPYAAAKPVLDLHTITGWSLSVIVVAIAAWRYVIRTHDRLKIPPAYLGVAMFLICLGGIFLLTAIAAMTVWRGFQRYLWRRNTLRQVQWSYLLVGIVILWLMYIHGTIGAHLGADFGIHNTAVNLLRQGKNPNLLLK